MLLASAPAVAEEAGRSFEIYGFAQADYIQDFERAPRSGLGRCVPALEDRHRRAVRRRRPGEHQRQAEPLRREGHDADRIANTPLDFKFEFDLFGTGADAGQTTFRLRHAYGEWGSILAGQTNSLFMDGDVFPNTIDYWGPAGMVFYRNVQIRWTPYRVGDSHFAIAIERPGNDIDSGNLRLIEGLEDVAGAERRGAAGLHGAVPLRR